ncbi:MAG TPA: ATP-dependent helicase HrpB [Xanthobacteraceae bacterium]|nr:ATP-dependent helicase HrpB [Xanthobacteraceae bacterium]
MTNPLRDPLPVDEALPALRKALASGRSAVLVAPPGAGKTTRVPLALLDEPWLRDGKILVLEPRRIAARAASARMAATLGGPVGDTVGLRIRFGSKVSKQTRIEVVTEGVFTRLVLDDPELKGVAAVLFDEFHERSLDADLGLALALDAQRGLRDDLRILVMSATLDGARVASILGAAPVIESKGRAFDVTTRYLGRESRDRIEPQMAKAITRALDDEQGSVLAFLPGAAEIRRTAERLSESVRDPSIDIVQLYGALDSETQDRAISPAPAGKRKVVLATSIAETSLTIEGVRIVVDSGLSRVPRYEPAVGLTRLETVRVSRASADQRRGRAGRTEPGVCYRLWDEPETISLAPFTTPEILSSDLAGLVLDLAVWGVADPLSLSWLDPPSAAALNEARTLLRELDAIDAEGRATPKGNRLARLPLPPRLAAMIVSAAEEDEALLAAEIAAVVSERGLGGDDIDLAHRVENFRRDRSRRASEARDLARRWAEEAGGKLREGKAAQAGNLLALAFPDRVAKARTGRPGEFLLENGRGARLDPAHALAREKFLAVAELAGVAAEARILIAATISEQEIERRFASHIVDGEETAFDEKSASLRGRAVRRLGAIVLDERPLQLKPDEQSAVALAEGIARLGIDRLPWSAEQRRALDRVRFMRRHEGEAWPDLSDDSLAETAADWLAPSLVGRTSLAQISGDDLASALHALTPHDLLRRLEKEMPSHFTAPTGSRLPIDYDAEGGPTVTVRVQELFGLDAHPSVAGGRLSLTLALTSPAGRPIQVTRDLPAFWRGSWADVRRDMRGRYPKHPWPEDPRTALPTRRAKPRGT